jgi:hypothetical protein
MSGIQHAILMVEGRETVWLTGALARRQEVADEDLNVDHVAAILHATGNLVGVPLVAWLVPEPDNGHDVNAVMIWIKGGRVGYLPRQDAFFWQQVIREFAHRYRMPVACAAHAELPAEKSGETSLQIVLWMPPLPWMQVAAPVQVIAEAMAMAAAEPLKRAERAERRRQLALAAIEEQAARDALQRAAATEKLLREEADAERCEAERRVKIQRRRDDLQARFGVEIGLRISLREIWVGQTEKMLIESRGKPEDMDYKVLKTKIKSTLKYGWLGANRYRLRVFLDDDVVVGWEDKG